MGLDLAALATNTHTITVDFMGQAARVTYKPAEVTTANVEEIDNAKSSEGADPFINFLCGVLTDWDVMIGKKKVPLTVAGLKPVPLALLRAVFLAIMQEAGSGEAGSPSSDG